MLESYASSEKKSKGRLYPEERSKYRSIYGRDRDKIISCNAFRRLQYKTQVFVNHEGDHFRTRLTHSLEVAQIARWIASGLKANKDLAEIISLAHDLGHTPFGHAGEYKLNQKMQDYGGFSHNAHTLKLITKIEHLYVDFEGLNLSWEMLEGVVKHNGPLKILSSIPAYILNYNAKHQLDLNRFPTIEAQISAISDDIAYNNHDLEDGLRAGLFEVQQLFELPLIGQEFQEVLKNYPQIKRELLVSEVKRKIISIMVIDVIHTTQNNLNFYKIKTPEDIRNHPKFLVQFSPQIEEIHQTLKNFLMKNMYRHPRLRKMNDDAHEVVGKLFDFFMINPNHLPEDEIELLAENNNKEGLAHIISDYIAGMTDRFAIREYEKFIK